MKKIYLFFAFTFFNILLIVATTYILLPLVEPWIKNVYVIKEHIAKQENKEEKRIIVVGGSSTLFGFNGEIIEKNTKSKFLNLGTHAGLPINYHLDKVLKIAKEGDIIFLPLEFSYYYRTTPYWDSWYIQNMLFWDPNYSQYITKEGIIFSMLTTKPTSLTKAIAKFLKKQETTPIAKWEQKEVAPNMYSFLNLDKYGDFCFNLKNSFLENPQYIEKNQEVSDFFIDEFLKARAILRERGVDILLIYPPTIKNPNFNLDDKNVIKKIDHLKRELKKHNIEILGNPRDYHFDRDLFLDTAYHLNCEGAKKRSLNFLKLLDSPRLPNP